MTYSVRLILLCLSLTGARLAWAQDDPAAAQRARDNRIVQALLRLDAKELSPEQAAAVLRYLERQKGTDKYLELVERFSLKQTAEELAALVEQDPEGNLGVGAARLLVKLELQEPLGAILAGKDEPAVKLLTALKLGGDGHANSLALPLVKDGKRSLAIRAAAVRMLGSNKPGQEALLKIVEAGELPNDLKFAAANALLSPAADEAIRAAAGKHLQLPATADNKPLPPVADMVKQTGDLERGKTVFDTVGTCIKCHKVKGEGKDVGPDLSEIGSKLSKEAFYVSILDPSAGISHNYETYVARLDDGTTISGVLVSDTDDELVLKTAEAIVKKVPKSEVEQYKKTTVSLMPADLQKALTAQNLMDVVEYLTTLKKVAP